MKRLKQCISRAVRYIRQGQPQVLVRVVSVNSGDSLKDKKIIITGASSGIGYETAKKCLLEGATVLCIARNDTKLFDAIERLKQETQSSKVLGLQWDIADTLVYKTKAAEAISLCGGEFYGIVNSAGVTNTANMQNSTPELWDSIFDINLKGLYFSTSELVRHMVNQNKGGVIINVASQAGLNAQTRIYALSKAALIHLTKGMAKEYIDNGIRVNAIAPGPTVSDMYSIDPDGDLRDSNRCKRAFRSEEIAETVVFLLSERSASITGEIIACNGGNSIRTDAFC